MIWYPVHNPTVWLRSFIGSFLVLFLLAILKIIIENANKKKKSELGSPPALCFETITPVFASPANKLCLISAMKNALEIKVVSGIKKTYYIDYENLIRFSFDSPYDNKSFTDMPDDLLIEYISEDGSVKSIVLSQKIKSLKNDNQRALKKHSYNIFDYVNDRIHDTTKTSV